MISSDAAEAFLGVPTKAVIIFTFLGGGLGGGVELFHDLKGKFLFTDDDRPSRLTDLGNANGCGETCCSGLDRTAVESARSKATHTHNHD